jgi:hypothetical protein
MPVYIEVVAMLDELTSTFQALSAGKIWQPATKVPGPGFIPATVPIAAPASTVVTADVSEHEPMAPPSPT